MKLDAVKFGLASAIACAILWVICSLLTFSMPSMISCHMMHGDLSQMSWSIPMSAVVIGLVVWSMFAGIAGGLIVAVYNKLLS